MNQDLASQLSDIIAILSDLCEDTNVPRNARAQFQKAIANLKSETENSVKVHETLNILDSLSEDSNLEPFARTQVYSLVSMLEKMQ